MVSILLLVDVSSKKAWAYVLTNVFTKVEQENSWYVSQNNARILRKVGLIRGLEGDNEFSSASIKQK